MGTNYYAVHDPCPTCGRGDRVHSIYVDGFTFTSGEFT